MTPKNIEFKLITELVLDGDNPRLPSHIQNRPQKEILDYIARKGGIEDLMSAIGENDYFEGEVLVVYRNEVDPDGIYRVIEGNRRLTAVKLLNDPSLCPKRPSIAELANGAKYKPTKLPVIVMPSRTEVLPYLGSRHIVGVKHWEPLAKARYMQQLLNASQYKKIPIKERYKAIAESIGSYKRTDYIKDNLDALAVYDVISDNQFFNIEDLNEESIDFGTLYTALGYSAIGAYVGISKFNQKTKKYERLEPIVEPKSLKKKNIETLAKWFFEKNEDGETILGDSRNIKKLPYIFNSPEALKNLEQGAALDIAYSYSQGVNEEFVEYLQKAKNHLHSASSLMGNTVGNKGHLKLAEEIFDQSKTIKAVMLSKLAKDE